MDSEDISFVLQVTKVRDILSQDCSIHVAEELATCDLNRERAMGYGVIELGPGNTGMLPHSFSLDIPFYFGVEPFTPHRTRRSIAAFLENSPEYVDKIFIVPVDALTFLRTRADASSTVVSSGVLEECVIGSRSSSDPLVERYRTELCAEIYRVTPVGGISLHGGCDDTWQRALQDAGFSKRYQSGLVYLK